MLEDGIQKRKIYIDETGVNMYTKRAYERAPRGERVNRLVGGQRCANVIVITAMSDQVGIVYNEIHVESLMAETFHGFMAGEDVVLLDKAPCHRCIQEVYPQFQ